MFWKATAPHTDRYLSSLRPPRRSSRRGVSGLPPSAPALPRAPTPITTPHRAALHLLQVRGTRSASAAHISCAAMELCIWALCYNACVAGSCPTAAGYARLPAPAAGTGVVSASWAEGSRLLAGATDRTLLTTTVVLVQNAACSWCVVIISAASHSCTLSLEFRAFFLFSSALSTFPTLFFSPLFPLPLSVAFFYYYYFSVLFPLPSAAAFPPVILQVHISYNSSFRSCPHRVRNCLEWKGAFSACFGKSVNRKSLKRSLFCLCNLSLRIVFLAATSVSFLMKWWKTSDVFTEDSVFSCKS